VAAPLLGLSDGHHLDPASRHADLLTVVMHELGHVFGYASIDPAVSGHDWMTATLGTGIRRLPDPASLTAAASSHESAFASGAALVNLEANEVVALSWRPSGAPPAAVPERSWAVALWADDHRRRCSGIARSRELGRRKIRTGKLPIFLPEIYLISWDQGAGAPAISHRWRNRHGSTPGNT
jgi:hypothetical protein